MDSSSSLSTEGTLLFQEQEESQLSFNPNEDPMPQSQPQDSAYTELRFEVDGCTQSASEPNDVKQTSEENKSESDPHALTEAEIASLPHGMALIYAETYRLDAESRRRKEEMEAEKARAAAARKANEIKWPGDTSEFPAESFVFFNPPGSHLRAQAIHIGTPKSHPLMARTSVYAVRQAGSADIEFRIARDGSTPEQIRQGPLTEYKRTRFNDFFKGMKEGQADLWARQLLAQVPGINDAIVKWK
ncbi:hypothetical protein F4814DRAFT_408646 [Daldinia grandis]|nr:hypothetical protein F4814DRAFT_408646 [Daldinia grandis]